MKVVIDFGDSREAITATLVELKAVYGKRFAHLEYKGGQWFFFVTHDLLWDPDQRVIHGNMLWVKKGTFIATLVLTTRGIPISKYSRLTPFGKDNFLKFTETEKGWELTQSTNFIDKERMLSRIQFDLFRDN